MSRTDKTDPWWVKTHKKHSFIEEDHDHRNGVCDLPARPLPGDRNYSPWGSSWKDGKCAWRASRVFWDDPISRCPCPMCRVDAYESIPRCKRQRIEGRKYTRDAWRDEY